MPRPWPKENHQRGSFRTYKRDPKGHWKAWSESFRTQIKLYMNANGIEIIPAGIPLAFGTLIFVPRPKSVSEKKRPFPIVIPDYDNIKYGIMNMLKGLLFYDDNQVIIDLLGGMFYADETNDVGVTIAVKEVACDPKTAIDGINFFGGSYEVELKGENKWLKYY